ncbi:MAG: YceI family protein [Oligoflexia bacterium]|nr:YceI family protein [Oligoflexia bacterium]
MRTSIISTGLLLAGLANFIPSAASALELEVDPAHSSIGFDIKHLVVSTVHGNFTDFNGDIDLNEKDLALSKISFAVKTSSISTNNAKRDEHLKSADFFDAQKYPEAKFVSTAIKAKGKNKYVLEGDLTIHGVTKKVKLDLVSLGKVKDPYGVEKRIFQASTDIVRKDFGLTYNATLESGGVVIGETAKLTIDLETAPKAAKQAKAQ